MVPCSIQHSSQCFSITIQFLLHVGAVKTSVTASARIFEFKYFNKDRCGFSTSALFDEHETTGTDQYSMELIKFAWNLTGGGS